MALSKVPTEGMLFKGALFGAGLLGMFLWRKDVLPKYMGMVSIGAASFGLCTVIWYMLKGKDKKRSDLDFHPINAFYEEIASQVNQELSQQGSQRGGFEVELSIVPETEEFDPIAFLRSDTTFSEIYKMRKEASDSGNFLKTCADSFILNEASTSETKIDNRTSVDPLELPLSEDEDQLPINSMGVTKKRDAILKLSKIKLSPLDAMSEMPCYKGHSSQNIPTQVMRMTLDKELETVRSEKEMSGIKWSENVRKLLGDDKGKDEKK